MSASRDYLSAVEVQYADEFMHRTLDLETSKTIADVLFENSFELIGAKRGPYGLKLSIQGTRLILQIIDSDNSQVSSHNLSMTPFKQVIGDYVAICQTLAITAAITDPYRVEAVDMARRAIHNDGSSLLMERLSKWIATDIQTARRLFTLIVAPQIVAASY